MDAEILKKEKEHLGKVVGMVKNAKDSLVAKMEVIGKENLEKILDVRENETGEDFEYFIQTLGERNEMDLKGKYTRYKEYEFLCGEPFFARIDLKTADEKNAKPFYIGKFGYSEKEIPVVIDWRAKLASVYYKYRYPQKDVFYETPRGKEVRDLTLKRTFEIENGELFKYYNNDIQLDESEIIAEKISKRTGGVLEDIVATIQLSQINIIEADPRQVCIVQGCVGSGKSTVAIHKLAHIFFNYPTIIHPQRSILVAKNQILSGYLSTLFPKLGIFDINYKTLRELVYNTFFREELGLQIDLDLEQDTSDFDIKSISKLQKKIERVHSSIEDRVNELFEKSEFISFRSLKYSKNSTPVENLSDILADLEEELTSEKEYLKEHPNSQRMQLFKENIKALRRLIEKITSLKLELRNKILKKLAESENIDLAKKLSFHDALIYLYIYTEIVGLANVMKFEYCVVDEGQDFSLLEYLVLSKMVLRGRFAIFGDLNQIIEKDGITKWEYIQKVISEAKTASVFELDTNYRSTAQIVELAREIMKPFTKKYLPKSINRLGSDPSKYVFENEVEMLDGVEKNLDKDLKNPDKSIGIICFSEKYLERIKEYIKQKFPEVELSVLKENTKINYTPLGVYLMNADDCKGLEFAKVHVIGLNLEDVKNIEEARKAFVSVTRAMNELAVYGVK